MNVPFQDKRADPLRVRDQRRVFPIFRTARGISRRRRALIPGM